MSVLLIAEHNNKEFKPFTLNAISAASQINEDVHVLVLGSNSDSVAKSISQIPNVKKVIHINNPLYENYLAENYTSAIIKLANGYSHIICSANTFGKNLMPRIAALLDISQVSDITKVVSDDTYVRPIYAGNAFATVKSTDKIKCITIRPTSFDPAPTSGGSAEIQNGNPGDTFDLSKCPFKNLSEDVDYSDNSFDFTTPVGKTKIKFKLLTGLEEGLITKDLEQSKKVGYNSEISTRLRYTIIEVDGDNKPETITAFSQNMLARDSMALRKHIADISPDIDMTSEVEIGGETVSVSIPLTVEFFWPKSIQ